MICSQSRYFKFSLTHGISLNKFYKSGESSVESPVLSLSPQHARSRRAGIFMLVSLNKLNEYYF